MASGMPRFPVGISRGQVVVVLLEACMHNNVTDSFSELCLLVQTKREV